MSDPEKAHEKPVTVIAAIVANLVIAAAKLIAASISGSSAMLAEGIHSIVDTGNEGLVLLGVARSKRPADDAHPLGYGPELYFYSLIVAIVLFGIGGGMSIFEGVHRLTHDEELGDPTWSYVVLAIAAVSEGTSLFIAVRAMYREDDRGGFFARVHRSKDPTRFLVVGEDTAALAGIVVAFLGILTTQLTGDIVWDAIGSMSSAPFSRPWRFSSRSRARASWSAKPRTTRRSRAFERSRSVTTRWWTCVSP